MDDPIESASAGEYEPYEPDESYMRSLFARPRQTKQKAEVFEAGHTFGGISREEADKLRFENLHRQPLRVKEEQ